MNIKTADKLQQLRKEKGYTQETLAEALGISRQAISKWERAEASPDTDNLISLAKLYKISIDELLDSDNAYQEIKENGSDYNEETNGDKVHIGKGYIDVQDKDGDEVHIDFSGIRVKEKGKPEVNVGLNGIHVGDYSINSKKKTAIDLVSGIASLLCIVIYLLIGFIYNLWHPTWIMFLSIPVLSSICEVFYEKKITKFNYPVFITMIYLYFGFVDNLWHPLWVLFISIPVFYTAFNHIQKLWIKDDVEINIEEE